MTDLAQIPTMSMPCRPLTLVIVAALLACAPGNTVRGDIVELVSVRDNTLIEAPLGDVSNGASFAFFAGRVGSQGDTTRRRGAVRFDLASAIPTGSTVNSVTVRLYCMQSNNGTQNIKLHKMLADWGEGTSSFGGGSGAPAASGDATWLHQFFPGVFWTTPGGDYGTTVLANKNVSTSGSYTWSSPGLTDAVQGWVNNPAGNFGFCVTGNEAQTQTVKKFATREWDSITQPTPPAIIAQRPHIIIDFTPAPPGSPFDLNDDGVVNGIDLAILLAVWGACSPCIADFNGDNAINGVDLAMMLADWGPVG
jgi:hypothetical protein